MAEGNVLVQTGQDVISISQKTRLAPMTQKDTWDVFSSLVISMGVSTHKKFFKSYENTFTSSDALKHLSSLNLIRSPSSRPELANPIPLSNIATKTSEGSALIVMQHFINARLIKDATIVPKNQIKIPTFDKRGLYELTPKALLVLERFVKKCGLDSEVDHLVAVLSTQPMPRPYLIRLPRHIPSDEIKLSHSAIHSLFRKFAGRWPRFTYQKLKENWCGVIFIGQNKAKDILTSLFMENSVPVEGRITSIENTPCVQSLSILDWLCAHTTVTSLTEAGELAAEFVRHGLLVLVKRGSATGTLFESPNSNNVPEEANAMSTGEFYYSQEAVYAVTDHGSVIARWVANLDEAIMASLSLGDRADPSTPITREEPLDPANGQRLMDFIKDPTTRNLFRRFLSEMRCDNDLAFWLDVEDFRSEFETAHNLDSTTIAVDLPPVEGSSRTPLDSSSRPENPYGKLANRPILIFDTYLAPTGSMKISFDVGQDLVEDLKRSIEHCTELLANQIIALETGDPFADPTQIGLEQLSVIVWIYKRIQNRVFSVMADTHIPRFIRWPVFLESRLNNPHVPFISSSEGSNIDPEVETQVEKGKDRAHGDD